MATIILSEAEVEELLTMRECIEVMEEAFRDLEAGNVHQPLRSLVRPADAAGFLGLMPGYRGGAKPMYGLKEVCVFPGNPGRGLDTHLGAVLLHSGDTGELLLLASASAITAIRTAAVSALATRVLAPEHASVLAILGTGVQARAHLEAIPLVRGIREVRVCGRDRNRAEQFAKAASPPEGVRRIVPCDTVAQAVEGADVVVTATSSREPLLRSEHLRAGMHINAVGSSVASSRELDGAAMAACALFVDRRESTVNESGDYLMALQEEAIRFDHIRGEIGEVLTGRKPGRTNEQEITLFKSLGLAIEDLASAEFLYEKAQRVGAGVRVKL